MSEILKIKAREVLDSRGNPTVEVDVVTDPWLKQMRHRSWRHVWPKG